MRTGTFRYLLCIIFFSCAPLPPARIDQSFVPDRDIKTVSLVREGLHYFKRGRFVEAEFRLRQALVLYPDAQNIKADLAAVLKSGGEYLEAQSIYEELIKEEPEAVQHVIGLSHLFYSSTEYEKSEDSFKKALEMALEDEDWGTAGKISRSLSVLYFKIGDEEQALDYSYFAYSLSKNNDQLVRHTRLLNAVGLHSRVEQLLSGGESRNTAVKSESRLLHQLALAYYGLEKFEEASKVEDLASRIVGDDYHTESEILIVNALLKIVLEESKKKEEGQAEELEEEESEEEEPFSPDRTLLSSSIALYWPVNLLEQLSEVIEEQKEEGEGTSWANPILEFTGQAMDFAVGRLATEESKEEKQ